MDFIDWMTQKGKSKNTIESYNLHLQGYLKWFKNSFSSDNSKLYRENILDYISYLLNIKRLNGKSINAKLAALLKYNEFLVENKIQDFIVITKKDYIKVQSEYLSPAKVTKSEVESFRQKILEKGAKRDYALVTLLAYSGLRISETLDIKLTDLDLTSKEILIRYGKGKKQRIIVINDKISNAIKEYLKERSLSTRKHSEFLFISRESDFLNRSIINKLFNSFSKNITPHTLRHFFCSYALENGWSTHEVALQAGHSNIHTTMMYTHPSMNDIKKKANLL